MKSQLSLKSRLYWVIAVYTLLLTSVSLLASYWSLAWYWLILVNILSFALVSKMLVDFSVQPLLRAASAIENGLSLFQDRDFNINIAELNYKELNLSIERFNRTADRLREERIELNQRELLLNVIIQAAPMAVVITTKKGSIIYHNNTFRQFIGLPQNLTKSLLSDLLGYLPTHLQEATESRAEGIYNIQKDNQSMTYHLICQKFQLNSQLHYLYMYKNMTKDFNRETSQIWKKVIRLISHELNNSIAPVQSLSNTASKIIQQKDYDADLLDIVQTIIRRTKHLHLFVDSYARFARLPKPNLKYVLVEQFAKHISHLVSYPVYIDPKNISAYFDNAQIEQVIINLVKNAEQSGSAKEAIEIIFAADKANLFVCVKDRGSGMSDEQIAQALLPFYTTKPDGSGIGLALSNEVVIAHGGNIYLNNRDGGGLLVELQIPLNH